MTEKRIALVTGASSGIGYETSIELAGRGHSVVATGRSLDKLNRLKSVDVNEGSISLFSTDLSEEDSFGSVWKFAEDSFESSPSLVVLSAGVGLKGTILKSNPAQWESLIKINYLAMMAQMRVAALSMLENSKTHAVQDIIIIGSTAGRTVSSMNSVYGSTKFALHSLVESLRREVCQSNIRVSLIEPGFVKSGFQDAAEYDPDWFSELERKSGPFLVPEDVARTIGFVTDQPSHVHLDDIRIRPTRQIA